jgi:hypothetical protein
MRAPPPTTPRQRHAAWDIIRRARDMDLVLRADLANNRVRFQPKDAMTLDLLRELHEHKAHVLLILDALATAIPPDGKPERDESCRFCGAIVWPCPAGAWQCGKCHALWRPQQSAQQAAPTTAQEQAGA